MTITDEQKLPMPRVQTENVWFCSKDGLNYVSPRCGMGGTHRRVTVTTTVVVTEGWLESVGDTATTPDDDIVLPPHPVTLRCPICGLTRNLPENWRDLMETQPDWDGQLRCSKDNVVMVEGTVTTPDDRRQRRREFRALLDRSSLSEDSLWIECPVHGRQPTDPDEGGCLVCVGEAP